MKNKLLTSTAVGALLAASSYAYAEGVTLKVFGGLNFLSDESHDVDIATSSFTGNYTTGSSGFRGTADFDADTGYVFGGAVGYQWDNGLILEVEAGYRRNKLDIDGVGQDFEQAHYFEAKYDHIPSDTNQFTKGDEHELELHVDGHVSAVSLMANAWYEFNLSNDQWRPYLGGGIGIAWLDLHGLGSVTKQYSTKTKTKTEEVGFHGTESGFAWQLGAGLGYEFAPGKQITLDYRYFNGPTIGNIQDNVQFNGMEQDIDYDYSAHNVMIGVRLGL